VELLKEEMRRTLGFLKWKSSHWLAKASPSVFTEPSPSPPVLEGLTAYAFRQSEVFLSLHDHFSSLWRGLTILDSSVSQPPSSTQIEDVMQVVDGGDM
jgi:hypothetical protein